MQDVKKVQHARKAQNTQKPGRQDTMKGNSSTRKAQLTLSSKPQKRRKDPKQPHAKDRAPNSPPRIETSHTPSKSTPRQSSTMEKEDLLLVEEKTVDTYRITRPSPELPESSAEEIPKSNIIIP
jgi:hypothetical protein